MADTLQNKLKITTDPAFNTKMDSYPDHVHSQMHTLRELIIQCAEEIEEVEQIEETLKWGEPSFLTKTGSTLRIDWKKKTPGQYQMYFKCTSRLVETFKIVFGSTFKYEKSRAIIFELDQNIPVIELKKCIKATLLYHTVKKELTLGIE